MKRYRFDLFAALLLATFIGLYTMTDAPDWVLKVVAGLLVLLGFLSGFSGGTRN